MALSETNQFKQLQAAMHTDIQALEESISAFLTYHQGNFSLQQTEISLQKTMSNQNAELCSPLPMETSTKQVPPIRSSDKFQKMDRKDCRIQRNKDSDS
ncbi:hypothetical protein STEG23_009542 [Scotinomys teguina]